MEQVRDGMREIRDWVEAHKADDAPEWPPFKRG